METIHNLNSTMHKTFNLAQLQNTDIPTTMSNPFWKRKSVRRKRSRSVCHTELKETLTQEAEKPVPHQQRNGRSLANDVRCMLSTHYEGDTNNLISTYWECKFFILTSLLNELKVVFYFLISLFLPYLASHYLTVESLPNRFICG